MTLLWQNHVVGFVLPSMAVCSSSTPWLWCRVLLVFLQVLAAGVNAEKSDGKPLKASYAPGDAIPVQCLNRTV